jgi:hypothetical protein
MRRMTILFVLLVGVLALAASGLADPGGKGKGKKNGQNRFSATVVVPDSGTCGNVWATDTSTRKWTVKKNNDGTFRVGRQDKGTFVTIAGKSPGACDTTGKHGALVNVGINGKFQGYLRGTVSGGAFNPTATCAAACVGDTAVFISTVFGSAAKFTCSAGYAGCKFNFEYSSPDKTLKFHHWQDRGTNGVNENFVGDIANS